MGALFVLGCVAVRWLVANRRLKAALWLKSQIKTETRKYKCKVANISGNSQIKRKSRKYPRKLANIPPQPHPAAPQNLPL
ncbi:hypothetical protein B9K06_18875 [Bacillus sp. OG2]|nr:hypothetical protein B9K06_18875 [Bacillus sp. OG2]